MIKHFTWATLILVGGHSGRRMWPTGPYRRGEAISQTLLDTRHHTGVLFKIRAVQHITFGAGTHFVITITIGDHYCDVRPWLRQPSPHHIIGFRHFRQGSTGLRGWTTSREWAGHQSTKCPRRARSRGTDHPPEIEWGDSSGTQLWVCDDQCHRGTEFSRPGGVLRGRPE